MRPPPGPTPTCLVFLQVCYKVFLGCLTVFQRLSSTSILKYLVSTTSTNLFIKHFEIRFGLRNWTKSKEAFGYQPQTSISLYWLWKFVPLQVSASIGTANDLPGGTLWAVPNTTIFFLPSQCIKAPRASPPWCFQELWHQLRNPSDLSKSASCCLWTWVTVHSKTGHRINS